MSQFNAIGEFGLNELLVKRLTTPGGSNAPSVAPELFPVITLENDRPEWGWLKGEMLVGRRLNMAAVAGQYNSVQLYLPSTARLVAVVEEIMPINTTQLLIGRAVGIGGGVAGWAASVTNPRDFRWAGQGSGCILETVSNAVAPTIHGVIGELTGQITKGFTAPIVIAPGTALVVHTAIVNQPLNFTLQWRERPAQPGELV